MIDPVAILTAFLKRTGTDLYTAIGDRVFPTPGIPTDLDRAQAIGLDLIGGQPWPTGGSGDRALFQIRATGKSPSAAMTLQGLVHDALHDEQLGEVTVGSKTYNIVHVWREGEPTLVPHPKDSRQWIAQADYRAEILGVAQEDL